MRDARRIKAYSLGLVTTRETRRVAAMGRLDADMADMTGNVSGKTVSRVRQPGAQRIGIHFTDGSVLAIASTHGRLTAALRGSRDISTSDRSQVGRGPTRRQQEYLEFIGKYIIRYRVSPAESDIARHFLVSAPSVNQMIQMLERRGFIRRQPGIPRSIAIVEDRTAPVGPGEATAAGDPRPNIALHRTGTRVARSGR
jgi:hypothetical protein